MRGDRTSGFYTFLKMLSRYGMSDVDYLYITSGCCTGNAAAGESWFHDYGGLMLRSLLIGLLDMAAAVWIDRTVSWQVAPYYLRCFQFAARVVLFVMRARVLSSLSATLVSSARPPRPDRKIMIKTYLFKRKQSQV